MRGNSRVEQLVNYGEKFKQHQPDAAKSESQDVAENNARPDPGHDPSDSLLVRITDIRHVITLIV